MESLKTRLTLAALPPSVNPIYRHTKRGIFRTEAYNTWANGEGWLLKSQIVNQPKWSQPVYIVGRFRRPRTNSDLDNRLKGIADLLQQLGIIENDRLIEGWNVCWSHDLAEGVAAELSISPASSPLARKAA